MIMVGHLEDVINWAFTNNNQISSILKEVVETMSTYLLLHAQSFLKI